MDYVHNDSSGTDDDLPSTHQNRYERDARVAGNGRSATAGSTSYSRMHNDLETEIHNTEREAYYYALCAFTAQSDAITWDKMVGLIPNLRKELRVSDVEHRELLSMVNNDGTIRRIREWRKANGIQSCGINYSQPVRESVRSPTFSASRKKQKTGSSVGPSPLTLHPPMQPPSTALERGPLNVRRGRKPKAMPHPPVVNGGRPLKANHGSAFGDREPTDVANLDQLIGRKVWIWWPEDKKFYEAVIKDFKEGRHARLVYDINTPTESWEWVDLKDISPQDIRWDGEEPGISQTVNRTGQGRGSKVCRGAVSGDGRGRDTLKDLTEKDVFPSQNGISKKGPSDIELLHTDTLIEQVEEVFSGSHPDATVVEKAKKVLKEHEQALIEAIARLEAPSELLHTDTLIKQVEKVFSVSHPDATVVEKAKKALKEHEQALIEAIAMLEVPSDNESDEDYRPFSQGHLMDQELGWMKRQYDEMHGDSRVQMV